MLDGVARIRRMLAYVELPHDAVDVLDEVRVERLRRSEDRDRPADDLLRDLSVGRDDPLPGAHGRPNGGRCRARGRRTAEREEDDGNNGDHETPSADVVDAQTLTVTFFRPPDDVIVNW